MAQVDDRLEHDADLVALERLPEPERELVTELHLCVHRRVVVREAVLAGLLGGIHRDVGVPEELVGGASGRRPARSRCSRDRRLAARKLERPAHRLEERLGDDLGAAMVDRLEQDGELVAAEARRGVAGAHASGDAAPDLGQHLVADRVAERVVDRLEVVEVEEQDRGGARAVGQRRLDALREERAVREAGERVVEGLMAEPLLQVGHLRERALEPAVLEHHAGVPDEGVEQVAGRRR